MTQPTSSNANTQLRPNASAGSCGLSSAELVEAFYDPAYRYAFRLCGNAADAEDLVQQSFLQAIPQLHQLREQDRAKGWLFAILRNHWIRVCKLGKRLKANAEAEMDQFASEQAGLDPLDRSDLQALLARLPAEFRLVVLMFYFEELSYKEIAEALDIPIGTVMSRLSRAKAMLRPILAEAGIMQPR